MSRIRIVPASAGDIPAMVTLLHELFQIEQDFRPDPIKQHAGLTQLLQDPTRSAIRVARCPGHGVVGMVTAQLVISTAEGARSAWVEDMVVRRDFQRLGIGRSLLASILRWARDQGATRAQLLVDTANTPALHYYDRLCWRQTQLTARSLALTGKGRCIHQ